MSADDLPSRVVAGISFVGRRDGWVKNLGGFKKGHHTLPDAANAITNAFLGKICALDLADEAEKLFQDVRAGLAYKRPQIALSVTSPLAMLGAKDFSVEIFYALEERDPTRYTVTTTLRGLMNVELTRTAEFARIFSGRFTEISFALKKGAKVEAVIDAVEELELGDGLSVTYPSDYRDCTIAVEGVDATVRCTGAALEVVFPNAGGPAELIEQFAAVREAFRISKGLSGLIV
ncbi:MAG: hypothetical protein HZA93_28640 [Verrucomicrobia bacterium]|nr:hypothetical protein [Verrucomicrobiota bacterium]